MSDRQQRDKVSIRQQLVSRIATQREEADQVVHMRYAMLTSRREVVEHMSELEGAVADGDGGGGGVAVLLVRPRRRWRALRGGLSLRRRVALDHFRPGFTCQRRQRRAASITRSGEQKKKVNA